MIRYSDTKTKLRNSVGECVRVHVLERVRARVCTCVACVCLSVYVRIDILVYD